MNNWKEFEKLVAKIYSDLQPGSKVTHNDKIVGKETGKERQIDVSIRANLAGHDMLIVIQARKRKRPADINAVGEFASVVKDVRASKGVLICNTGFTKKAKEYASNIGVDLCSVHDAQSRDWELDIKIPLLWIDLLPQIIFMIKCFLKKGNSIPKDPKKWIFSTDYGKTRLIPLDTFVRLWNEGKLDRRCNIIHSVFPEQRDIKILVSKRIWRPVESLEIQYIVSRRAWLGYFKPTECMGILDTIKDEFTASYLNIGEIPMKRDESWKAIEDPEKVVVSTKGTLVTTERWQICVDEAIFKSFIAKKID